jgi:hypothetical protein
MTSYWSTKLFTLEERKEGEFNDAIIFRRLTDYIEVNFDRIKTMKEFMWYV